MVKKNCVLLLFFVKLENVAQSSVIRLETVEDDRVDGAYFIMHFGDESISFGLRAYGLGRHGHSYMG